MAKKIKFDATKIKIKKDPWVISSFALGLLSIILLILLFVSGFNFSSKLSGEKAGTIAVDFLNSKVGSGVSYVSYEDLDSIYQINVKYQNQDVPVFITKDGKYFVQVAVPINDSASINSTNNEESGPVIEVNSDDDSVKGEVNAPITIIEFSDYQCPYCSRFYLQTFPQLDKEYIQTGKVKLIYRDFPLSSIHPRAQKAAEAAECAGEQKKYYEMHNKLFENQGALEDLDLKKYAKEIGLNTVQFNSCLDSGKMKEEVENDYQEGLSYGVSGTPAFFINGRLIEGAQPFSAFKKIIDSELAK